MHDSQRERLGHLLERALTLPIGDRASFIENATGDDWAFREELTSLVEASEPSSRLFDVLAEQLGPALATTRSPGGERSEQGSELLRVGEVVSHYELLERIGGGMGVVYRAHDLRLDRPVALKFLPPALSTNPRARARLFAEARAASALDHPNIGAVHGIADAEPGGVFIVLAWCEGETLKEILQRGPLPVPEVIALARQLAAALAAAHAVRIIHRDVKPSNIVRTNQGVAKLVDFGIAKVVDSEPTREGWTPGTVAYMSPEQTRGASVDPRTDIWSLGVVLYEMLAGRRPFRGDSDAMVIHAIRQDEPEPLTNFRSDVPTALVKVIAKCLAKDPVERQADADELAAAIIAIESSYERESEPIDGELPGEAGKLAPEMRTDGQPPSAMETRPRPRRKLPRFTRTRTLIGAIAGSMLVWVASGEWVLDDEGLRLGATPLDARESAVVAVLPFRVSGPGLEGWEEGMMDLLSTGLDGAAGLRAVDGMTVLARWRRELGEVRDADLSAALHVARLTGARFAIEGSVISIGSEVRLVARLHDLESAIRLGSAQVEGTLEAPHGLVDGLGLELLRILFRGEVSDLPRVDLAAVTTTSTEALRAYLEGEQHYREGRWEDAAAAYRRAVGIDSTFALAHHRADLALGWTPGRSGDLQRYHRERARELSARLPEREKLLVNGTYRMIRNAIDSTVLENPIEQAVRMYPNDAEAWYLLAEAYYHSNVLIKRPAEVEAAFQRAVDLDPSFAPYRIHLIEFALQRGDRDLTSRRIDEYRAVTDDDDLFLLGYENALRTWFADSVTQAAMLDSLVSLSPARLAPPPSAPHMLRPQEWAIRGLAEAVQRLGPRPDFEVDMPRVVRDLARNLANQGRFTEAIALIDDPALRGTDQRGCLLVELTFLEAPVPEDVLRGSMGAPGEAGGPAANLFCGALAAVALGERAAFEARRIQLLATGQVSLARMAQAYWDWKQEGALEQAARGLRLSNAPTDTYYWTFWLGEIYRELGRGEAAEEAYLTSLGPRLSLNNYSLAWYRLATIYDERGDARLAREAWEHVLAAWENADPALRPKVDEARSRLATLR